MNLFKQISTRCYLADLAKTFSYTKTNLRDISITANLNDKTLLLSNFYSKPFDTKGTCFELMNSAYCQIKEERPELQVFRAQGCEPSQFSRPNTHNFLVITDGSISCDPANKNLLNQVLSKGILFDPSFRKLDYFVLSSYRVNDLIPPKIPVDYSSSALLSNGRGVPIGNIGETVINIYALFNNPSIISVGFSFPGVSYSNVVDLNSPELDETMKVISSRKEFIPKSREFIDFFAYLREIRVNITDRKLVETFDITVR
jgi:hypothetical protein